MHFQPQKSAPMHFQLFQQHEIKLFYKHNHAIKKIDCHKFFYDFEGIT